MGKKREQLGSLEFQEHFEQEIRQLATEFPEYAGDICLAYFLFGKYPSNIFSRETHHFLDWSAFELNDFFHEPLQYPNHRYDRRRFGKFNRKLYKLVQPFIGPAEQWQRQRMEEILAEHPDKQIFADFFTEIAALRKPRQENHNLTESERWLIRTGYQQILETIRQQNANMPRLQQIHPTYRNVWKREEFALLEASSRRLYQLADIEFTLAVEHVLQKYIQILLKKAFLRADKQKWLTGELLPIEKTVTGHFAYLGMDEMADPNSAKYKEKYGGKTVDEIYQEDKETNKRNSAIHAGSSDEEAFARYTIMLDDYFKVSIPLTPERLADLDIRVERGEYLEDALFGGEALVPRLRYFLYGQEMLMAEENVSEVFITRDGIIGGDVFNRNTLRTLKHAFRDTWDQKINRNIDPFFTATIRQALTSQMLEWLEYAYAELTKGESAEAIQQMLIQIGEQLSWSLLQEEFFPLFEKGKYEFLPHLAFAYIRMKGVSYFQKRIRDAKRTGFDGLKYLGFQGKSGMGREAGFYLNKFSSPPEHIPELLTNHEKVEKHEVLLCELEEGTLPSFIPISKIPVLVEKKYVPDHQVPPGYQRVKLHPSEQATQHIYMLDPIYILPSRRFKVRLPLEGNVHITQVECHNSQTGAAFPVQVFKKGGELYLLSQEKWDLFDTFTVAVHYQPEVNHGVPADVLLEGELLTSALALVEELKQDVPKLIVLVSAIEEVLQSPFPTLRKLEQAIQRSGLYSRNGKSTPFHTDTFGYFTTFASKRGEAAWQCEAANWFWAMCLQRIFVHSPGTEVHVEVGFTTNELSYHTDRTAEGKHIQRTTITTDKGHVRVVLDYQGQRYVFDTTPFTEEVIKKKKRRYPEMSPAQARHRTRFLAESGFQKIEKILNVLAKAELLSAHTTPETDVFFRFAQILHRLFTSQEDFFSSENIPSVLQELLDIEQFLQFQLEGPVDKNITIFHTWREIQHQLPFYLQGDLDEQTNEYTLHFAHAYHLSWEIIQELKSQLSFYLQK